MNEVNNVPQNNATSDVQHTINPTPPKSDLATASLILGLSSFVPILGAFAGLLAIIFGIVASIKILKGLNTGRKSAIAGMFLSVLGILFTVAILRAISLVAI